MTDPDFAQSLVDAAIAAFPRNTDWPNDRETITGYETYRQEGVIDPAVPLTYQVPQIGPVEPVARKAVAAVLFALTDGPLGEALADELPEWLITLRNATKLVRKGGIQNWGVLGFGDAAIRGVCCRCDRATMVYRGYGSEHADRGTFCGNCKESALRGSELPQLGGGS